MKPLVLAIALALAAPLPVAAQSQAQPQLPQQADTAKPPVTPDWVQKSNDYAQVIIRAQADFAPEQFSFFGIPGYDDKVADLGPDVGKRYTAALASAKQTLQGNLASERDPNVRQDLQIMIDAADEAIEATALNERLSLPWTDAPRLVFSGLQGLLSDQTPPERRAKALDRLKRYVGMTPDTTPITVLGRQRYEERAADKALLRPTKRDVEQALGNVDTYVAGIRQLFAKYEVEGAEDALAAMDTQLHDYAKWARSEVLPQARQDTKLPPELYAFQLEQYGIDIDPQLLIRRAQVEFMETRAPMRQLSPVVEKQRGL